ncbi:YafY family protein [Paenibacillus sp. LHD-117]|uniref:helix-turn-helix transcriptional regulator n=1 Tax=Paenibacillus sp. LHD-117 TaxID=3071412 RepID=UPI0027E1DD33|nr:YafY family protein [Paenibacillus sp. LHD-117]MDQ6422823.1 YafY family protein [Paenibacillus sp. LHD-117]
MQKAQRLIQMMMIINARKSFTVRELADEFGLSTRTVTRDLQELSELGVPVYTVQGRGGGYRLLRERMLPPISFTEGEAVAIFFACQSLQFLGSLPFGGGADSALHKFYHYMPADARGKIDAMKERVMIWSPYRRMSAEVLETLLRAIMEKSVVRIRYRSSAGESERDVQPIGLYASSGYWYCPAYCMKREEMRQFRADRIVTAELRPDIPYREELASLTLQNKPDQSHLEKVELVAQLTAEGAWQLESNRWFGPHLERCEDGSGLVRVQVPKTDLPYYVDAVWSLGAQARVLAPLEAIDLLQGKLKELEGLYAADGDG